MQESSMAECHSRPENVLVTNVHTCSRDPLSFVYIYFSRYDIMILNLRLDLRLYMDP